MRWMTWRAITARPHNEAQAETLFNVYQYNMEVVNFWLSFLVLPTAGPSRHWSPHHRMPSDSITKVQMRDELVATSARGNIRQAHLVTPIRAYRPLPCSTSGSFVGHFVTLSGICQTVAKGDDAVPGAHAVQRVASGG